jgi:Na+/H+ antiporter
MQAAGIHQIELILLFLLLMTAGLATLARRFQTPYPLVLVVGGLVLSLVPRLPHVSLNPDIVFLVLLPPLLFSAALNTSWRDFRYNLVSILMLAFGLVGFTVLGVSLASQWLLPGFDRRLGLVLGAVVATTDAIAATAIARRIGLPRSITDVLEGESLVNDASGLLALEFAVALVVSGDRPTVMEGSLRLGYLVVFGVAIGLLAGVLIHLVQKRIIDAPIEISLTLAAPYLSYLGAESIHASGVLATIACGLYLGRNRSNVLSTEARLDSSAVWNTLDFVLNGTVFILIGLQLPNILAGIRGMGRMEIIRDGVVFSALVIGLRLLWIYPGAWIAHQIRGRLLGQRDYALKPKATFIVGWTGMRGVLALAAAISLPEYLSDGSPFPHRNEILFLTFCVIFVTLVLQGLSLPVLIRKLGLAGAECANVEEQEARRRMVQSALAYLEKKLERDDSPIMRDLLEHYKQRLALLEETEEDEETRQTGAEDFRRYRKMAQKLRMVERSAILEMHSSNQINDEVLRTLERELDLLDARFSNV